MELSWLEDFLALAEHNHFSNAAESRNISQPAFSRRIKLLEEWLGTPLFKRNTYGVELTLAGQTFQRYASDLARGVRTMREDTRSQAGLTAATLRFASTNHLSIHFFPAWLRKTEGDDPTPTPVRLISDTSGGCARLLSDGLVDFMLCFHNALLPPALDLEYFVFADVGTDVLIPVSAPSGKSTAPMHALPGKPDAPAPFLSFLSEKGLGGITAANLKTIPFPTWLQPTFTAQMTSVLVEMAKAGRGVAWLPASLVASDIAAGNLVRAGNRWDIEIAVRLWRHRAPRSEFIERFWAKLSTKPSPRQVGAAAPTS